MGTARSSFNKATFRRGIRGYRQMFASLHLEQKELKKLWVEFGKIDTDNGGTVSIRELLWHCDLDFTPFAYRLFSIFDEDNSGAVDFREFVLSTWNCCTMDQNSLIRFAFDLFDGDHSGAIETAEMEVMLREIYGESFVDSPTAALTLKRVKELSSHSEAKTPTKETPVLATAKDGLQLDPTGRVYALSFEAFREFCREHAGMLLPAFTLQRKIRSKIVSESFWKGCAARRNGDRLGGGKGKTRKHQPRKPFNLEELTTMIRFNEGSLTGTVTDQGTTTKNGSTSGLAATTSPDHGLVHPPVKPPPTASPSPAPDSLETPTGSGGRGEDADANKPLEGASASSPKAPNAAAHDGSGKHENPKPSGATKKGGTHRQGEGGENNQSGGAGGTPKKRGSGARGVVAVEEAAGGAEGEHRTGEVPRFSMQHVSNGGRTTLGSHGDVAQAEVLPKTDVHTEPPKRQPRQSYPVPIDAGGRGASAWARGNDGGLDKESDLPRFQGDGGDDAGAATRRNRESKVDSPAMAAAKAAAAYNLPAVRETGAQKRSSHQARDLVAGGGVCGGRAHRSSARPLSASPDARSRRRETGQAAAAASAAAKRISASPGGHPTRTTMDTNRENVHGDERNHHHHPGSHRPERLEK